MNNNNSSKQILLSVLGVAILVVAVVGISFAAFSQKLVKYQILLQLVLLQ